MSISFAGRTVLVTGGTRGLGLATGLAFSRFGARCVLTHRWGSADEGAISAMFAHEGLPLPSIVQADVSNDADTDALLRMMHDDLRWERVDVFVSNVAFAQIVRSLDDYQKRSFHRSLDYSAWPLAEYPRRIRQLFGSYPRYIVGISSHGPDTYLEGYDFVAIAKATMETLCRYLAHRLHPYGTNVNIVRPGVLRTDSLRATFGTGVDRVLDHYLSVLPQITLEEVGNSIVALCSGLMDGVSGEVISVDRGARFSDTLLRPESSHQPGDVLAGGIR